LVLANPNVAARTLPDLIALAKTQPRKLTFATDGPRNFSGMIAAWINKLAGTKIDQVPYPAMPQGIQDTIAGRVQLIVLAIPSAAPFIQNGSLRPLESVRSNVLKDTRMFRPLLRPFPVLILVGGWLSWRRVEHQPRLCSG
jgi:tripartite-type tricarboxylate transporter receptor subunit TctC